MATVTLHASRDLPDTPLVLLAPFPLDARAYDSVVGLLAEGVLTVDPPGFADAEGGDEASLEAYARALAAALDARGVGRVVVAGNSMGGYAAMAFAELYPERVAGIGLLGTKATADAAEARANRHAMADAADAGEDPAALVGPMLEKLLGPTSRASRPEVVALVEGFLAGAPASGIAWAQRAMAARPDRTPVLAGLGVPALVLHGAEDPLMDAAAQQAMASALGVEVTTVPDAGHLVPLEAPRVTADALTRLVAASRR